MITYIFTYFSYIFIHVINVLGKSEVEIKFSTGMNSGTPRYESLDAPLQTAGSPAGHPTTDCWKPC